MTHFCSLLVVFCTTGKGDRSLLLAWPCLPTPSLFKTSATSDGELFNITLPRPAEVGLGPEGGSSPWWPDEM